MAFSTEKLVEIYEKAFRAFEPERAVPDVAVSFYPYVNVNHTIRVRNGKVLVRVATLLQDAPARVHEALAVILVAKLLRHRVPPRANAIYRDFISDPDFRREALDHKKEKGRKVLTGPRGEAYDLEEIFDTLNSDYFGGTMKRPSLSWSGKRTFRRLGHYDEAHNAIVISRSLDSKRIPAFVVEYVVYHEMLHILHPPVHVNGRRYSHTAKFREDELKYDYFDEAESWIERNFDELKRFAGKKAGRKKRYWGLFD